MTIKFGAFIIIISMAISCKQKAGPSTDAAATVAQDTAMRAGDTIKLSSLADNNDGSLVTLVQYAGKKPSEVDFWNKNGVGARISKLMGNAYGDFQRNWNDETPIIESDSGMLFMTGCKIGACLNSRYVVVIDTKINIINVYALSDTGQRMRSFEEKGTILAMSYKMQDWFDKIYEEHMSAK